MFINKLLGHNDVTLFSPLCFLLSWLLSFILSHYKLLKNICTKFIHVTQNWSYFNVHYSF